MQFHRDAIDAVEQGRQVLDDFELRVFGIDLDDNVIIRVLIDDGTDGGPCFLDGDRQLPPAPRIDEVSVRGRPEPFGFAQLLRDATRTGSRRILCGVFTSRVLLYRPNA